MILLRIIFTIVAVVILVMVVIPLLIKGLRIYGRRATDFLKERIVEDFEGPRPNEERGLYRRYFVKKLDDPTGRHNRCFHFVLDLTHDPYAIPAIRAYADACRGKYPVLARDLDTFKPFKPFTLTGLKSEKKSE